ncbi:RNA binding S1 domain-containing protein [Nitritalea halalkaliphila LW7]|uniref:RNA binding S1 domain-containing protein n=1 Tax=Nitritalea halalkaliphila LW7 TaxID=1189621 RepID=I5C6X1_9BACT|nr:S1-like domain-containing RNA-binding protein [Nitritalea halalkaliphila]EIM77573.1 RNA binding S1 domain-containing protein [Nitritalea halalkaliphila LW7]
MEELGKLSRLPIARLSANGAYLMTKAGEEVLLPNRYLKGEEQVGQEIEVFIYTDSEDRPVAVTDTPKAMLDEFAVMELKSLTKIGAFMDWGLLKDLFVPKSEMLPTMEEGKLYLIRVCLDYKGERLIGSARYEDFLENPEGVFTEGEALPGLFFSRSPLGYKILLRDKYEGLLYSDEVFRKVYLGSYEEVYIKKVRPDGKIDLSLDPVGREKYEKGAEKILLALQKEKFLPLHDKSSPETIKNVLGMSKKSFKQAIGQLYKAKRIRIEPDGIYLTTEI